MYSFFSYAKVRIQIPNPPKERNIMENKICLLLCVCPVDIQPECKGDRCAWYVPPRYPGMEGRCAVQALPDLAEGVRRL